MFFDSETDMLVISGVRGREAQKGPEGKALEGGARLGGVLPSWLMSQSKKTINDLAGSKRALCQGNLAPNHYWNKTTNTIDKAATIEQMDREMNLYGIDSWTSYSHFDPGQSGAGFEIDNDNAMSFYEESR